MKKIIVKQNEEKPVPIEVLAESIKSISEGVKKLLAGPLNDRCLKILIQHASPANGYGKRVGIMEIEAVLCGIENLGTAFLKKKEKP